MKRKEIKNRYGSKEICANCQSYRFDETCNFDDHQRKHTDRCNSFQKRIQMKRKIIISTIAFSVIVAVIFLIF